MADFIIVPNVDHTADPDDMTNAILAFGVTSPATVALTNGTAYRAYEIVRSPVSDVFTPVAPPAGTVLWQFNFDGADSPAAILNGRSIYDGGSVANSPTFDPTTVAATTHGTVGALAFTNSSGSAPDTASFDMTDAEVGTSYTIRFAWAMNYISGSAKTATVQMQWQNDAGDNLGTIWEEVDFSTGTDTFMYDGDVSSVMPSGATRIRLIAGPSGANTWGGFSIPLFYIRCTGQDNTP